MQKLKVGNGFDQGTQIGPLINAESADNVQSLLDDALNKGGADLLYGGKRHALGNNFFIPTVLGHVTEIAGY